MNEALIIDIDVFAQLLKDVEFLKQQIKHFEKLCCRYEKWIDLKDAERKPTKWDEAEKTEVEYYKDELNKAEEKIFQYEQKYGEI